MTVASDKPLQPRPNCPRSDKRAFTSRSAAKTYQRLLKRTNPGRAKTVRPYLCGEDNHGQGCGLWHVGRLPQATVEGRMTAREVYGRAS